jgi:hypothetical protein
MTSAREDLQESLRLAALRRFQRSQKLRIGNRDIEAERNSWLLAPEFCLYAFPPKLTKSSTSRRSNQVATSSRSGAIF